MHWADHLNKGTDLPKILAAVLKAAQGNDLASAQQLPKPAPGQTREDRTRDAIHEAAGEFAQLTKDYWAGKQTRDGSDDEGWAHEEVEYELYHPGELPKAPHTPRDPGAYPARKAAIRRVALDIFFEKLRQHAP